MKSESIENPSSNDSQKANTEKRATHSINEFSFDIIDRDLLRCEDFCEHLQIFTNYNSCSTLEVNYDYEDGQILVAGKNNRNIARTSMAGSDDENVRFLANFRASNGWGIISLVFKWFYIPSFALIVYNNPINRIGFPNWESIFV